MTLCLDLRDSGAQRSAMPTIRDLVATLSRRQGVDAAVVLGRDGLLIDGQSIRSLDPEHLAAQVPPIVLSAVDLGLTARRGGLVQMVMSYDSGTVIVMALSDDASLLLLLSSEADLASLLYELRRHRSQLSTLV